MTAAVAPAGVGESPPAQATPFGGSVYFPIVTTPKTSLGGASPSPGNTKASLSVKAKKLGSVVQNIIDMIG